MRSDARKKQTVERTLEDAERDLRVTTLALDSANERASRWRDRFNAERDLVNRLEAGIRFIEPDHITPAGARVLRSLLKDS